MGAMVGILLFAAGVVNRLGLWRLEGSAGFPLDVPRVLPSGFSLESAGEVPSASKDTTTPLVAVRYGGKGDASLIIFESPYPIMGDGGLPPGHRTAILERGQGDGMVLEGSRHVGTVYVEAESVGVDEPSFARMVASLHPLDGGWLGALFSQAKR